MRAGRLRHRVNIQVATEVKGSYGSATKAWSNAWSGVPASIEPLSGREFFSADEITAESTHKIVMRYRVGVTKLHRILFGTRIFNITSVININERGKELVILATEDA